MPDEPFQQRHRWRFYRTTSGHAPAKEFILRLPLADQAAISAAMKDTERGGLKVARHLRGDVYEYRRSQHEAPGGRFLRMVRNTVNDSLNTHDIWDDDERDELDELITEIAREHPEFPAMVEAALQERLAARARGEDPNDISQISQDSERETIGTQPSTK